MSSSPPSLQYWAASDVGRVRDHNEDAYLVVPELGLYALADGMGGHAAGEVASAMALDSVRQVVVEGRELLDAYQPSAPRETRGEILRLLERAGRAACEAVYAEGQRDENKRGMGCTLCVLLVVRGRAFVGHVGDSRIYLLRAGKAHQLTQDHSLRNELLKRGRLTQEQIEKVPQKGALTRAIGVYPSVDVDTLDVELAPGDRVVICSDGLTTYMHGDELSEALKADLESGCDRLIQAANERGGRDNITVVLLSVPDQASAAAPQIPIEVLRTVPLLRYMSYQELMRLAGHAEARVLEAEASVFRQGEPGHEMYVVLSGSVRVHDGDKEIVKLGAGEQFGEMALVDKSPRSASVTTLERTRLLVVKREDFFHIMRHERDMAVKLLWHFVGTLTSRLRNTTDALGEARSALELSEELFVDLEPDP